MKAFGLIFLLISLVFQTLEAQTVYTTRVSSKQIKTLQVRVAGEPFSNPYITLGGPNRIEINFDALNSASGGYAYSITHCNADWTQSALSPIEYMSGFQGTSLEDFANSMGTTVSYTNYRLLLPNEDTQFKVSGNYAVTVYSSDNPGQPVFTACFSIVEPLVGVAATVSGNTDIDTNETHQQVSFVINNKNFPITFPQSDLKIWVYQNNRRDNAVTGLQPMSILNNQIAYTNNQNLIFDAGNEYRRMEFLSTSYNGMHVQSISFHNPYYHVELMTDHIRSHQTYQYDQDQDGRYFIRCSNCNDPDTEADYYIVHFTLAADELPGGNVYLNGELVNNLFDSTSKMDYNPQSQQYEKSLLLKQGSYNYQYLFVADGQTKGQTGPIAGNYYQTQNEYSIYVYYCPISARYDRLIGVTTIRNTMPVF